jgi:hypothetical protein
VRGEPDVAALDAGEVTARGLLARCIARLEAENPRLNAVVTPCLAAAEAEAAASDARRGAGVEDIAEARRIVEAAKEVSQPDSPTAARRHKRIRTIRAETPDTDGEWAAARWEIALEGPACPRHDTGDRKTAAMA